MSGSITGVVRLDWRRAEWWQGGTARTKSPAADFETKIRDKLSNLFDLAPSKCTVTCVLYIRTVIREDFHQQCYHTSVMLMMPQSLIWIKLVLQWQCSLRNIKYTLNSSQISPHTNSRNDVHLMCKLCQNSDCNRINNFPLASQN